MLHLIRMCYLLFTTPPPSNPKSYMFSLSLRPSHRPSHFHPRLIFFFVYFSYFFLIMQRNFRKGRINTCGKIQCLEVEKSWCLMFFAFLYFCSTFYVLRSTVFLCVLLYSYTYRLLATVYFLLPLCAFLHGLSLYAHTTIFPLSVPSTAS